MKTKKVLKKGLLTNAQIKKFIESGYLNAKGKKKAQEVLDGKHDKRRYKIVKV